MNEWSAFCNVESSASLNYSRRLCSAHFKEEDIGWNGKHAFLRFTSVPTFLTPGEIERYGILHNIYHYHIRFENIARR